MNGSKRIVILSMCLAQCLIAFMVLFYTRATPIRRFSTSVQIHGIMTNVCSLAVPDTKQRVRIVNYLNGKLQAEKGLRGFIDGEAIMLLIIPPSIMFLLLKRDKRAG